MGKYKSLIRWLMAIVCLFFLVRFFYDNRSTLSVTLSLNLWILFGILALEFFYYSVQALRFRLVIEKCGDRRLPFWQWVKLFIIGRFLNTILTQSGNISRGIILKRDYGITYTRYIAASASMTWIDAGINLLLSIAVVLILDRNFQMGTFAAWKILALTTMAVIALPIVLDRFLRHTRFGSGRLLWLQDRTAEVLQLSVQNLTDRKYLLKMFFLGVVIFARTVLILHLYFLIVGREVSLAALSVLFVFLKLSFYVNLTPGNLGLQEILLGQLSELMNIGMLHGVLVSAFIRVISTGVIMMLGFSFGGWDMIRKHDIATASNSSNEQDISREDNPKAG